MKTKAFSREEREAMIVTWFAIRIQKGNEKFATMNEIARGLDMRPSSHLLRILYGMCDNNKLTARRIDKPGRWTGNSFMLKPGTYQPPQARQIKLNIRGRNAGQLEFAF